MSLYPDRITVKAGDEAYHSVVGNYIRLESSSGNVPIQFRNPDSSTLVILKPGEDAFFERFTDLLISHTDAADQVIEFYIGQNARKGSSEVNGIFQPVGGGDNSANPPTTNVGTLLTFVDRDSLDTFHYMGGVYRGPSAGNYTRVQLRNPDASIKQVIIRSAVVSVTGNASIRMYTQNGALTSNDGQVGNKFLGYNDGAAQVNSEHIVAIGGNEMGPYLLLAANTPVELIKKDPIILGFANRGLVISCNTVNIGMAVSFEWEEI